MQIKCLGFSTTLLSALHRRLGNLFLFVVTVILFNDTNLGMDDKFTCTNTTILPFKEQKYCSKSYSIIGNYFINYTWNDQFIVNYPNCC